MQEYTRYTFSLSSTSALRFNFDFYPFNPLPILVMNTFLIKFPHHILLLLFFFSLSSAVPFEDVSSISLTNPRTSKQQFEDKSSEEIGIKDIDEFMHQILDPVPTFLPQELLEDITETPISSDELEADEQFFQEKIGRDSNEFFVLVETVPPTETSPPVLEDEPPSLASFCNRGQRNCIRAERCDRFIFRPSSNRRLNRAGRRMRQICRRRCGIRSQTC